MVLNASKPIVGITTYLQEARWGVWEDEATLLPIDYAREVAAAGAYPVLLPPIGTDVSVLDRLDGLLVAGGTDVNPALYGADQHATTLYQEDRDTHDTLLTRAALTRGLPLLAICRGMQVLNTALGGTLHQHIPELLGHDRYRPEPGVYGQVNLTISPGTLLADILGEAASAPCYHHQAVDRVAPGLKPTATSPEGLVEALELADDSPYTGWVLAVQWHPEHNPDDRRIIDAFVNHLQK